MPKLLPWIAGLPERACSRFGRWKQRSGGEATHLPFVQVLIGPHGISGFAGMQQHAGFFCGTAGE